MREIEFCFGRLVLVYERDLDGRVKYVFGFVILEVRKVWIASVNMGVVRIDMVFKVIDMGEIIKGKKKKRLRI